MQSKELKNVSESFKITKNRYKNSKTEKTNFDFLGLKLDDPKTLEFLCNGLDPENLSLDKARDINRAVKTKIFKKMVDSDFEFLVGEIKINLPFIKKEDLETSKFSQINLFDFIQPKPGITETQFSNYLNGLLHQYGIITEKNVPKSIEFYTKGRTNFGCHSCCYKLVQRHLESNDFDQHNPNLNFNAVLSIFGELCLQFGIIELERDGYLIESPMLHYLSILVDTSEEFREFVYECVDEVREMLEDTFNFESVIRIYGRVKETPLMLYKLFLVMVLELEYTNKFFLFGYEVLARIVLYSEFESINNFLGVRFAIFGKIEL